MINPNNYILLVDDNADDRHILHHSFEEIHWSSRLKLVGSADEAMEYLDGVENESLPSLIVLDYHMPQINGTEALKRLKEIESFKDIPVVLYASSMSSLLAYKLTSLGALCCFHKPANVVSAINLAKVLKTIAEDQKKTQLHAALN